MTKGIDVEWFQRACRDHCKNPALNRHPFILLCQHFDKAFRVRPGSPEASMVAMQSFVDLSIASTK